MYCSLFSEMDDAISRSEIDRVLRGDLSDLEDFADEDEVDEEDLYVTDDVLQERLQAFEEYMSQQNILHEASEEEEEVIDDPPDVLPDANNLPPGAGNVALGDDLENVPLFDRLTRKQQKEWQKEREIRRWRVLNNNDDFSQDITNIQFSPPPLDVLLPKEYFDLLFDRTIVQNMVQQTNLYSVQQRGNSINTTIAEMEQFLGIHILSGIIHMPSYRMYWADNTRFSVIADTEIVLIL